MRYLRKERAVQLIELGAEKRKLHQIGGFLAAYARARGFTSPVVSETLRKRCLRRAAAGVM